MTDIGLSTSNDYIQGGKLTLDVNKLTSALKKDPQKVIDLFTQPSTSYSNYTVALNSKDVRGALSKRNNEEGLFQRISDVYQKYAGRNYDKNGNQGILLMKAGMSNTSSDSKNALTKQLKQQQKTVDDFKTTMNSHKTRYSNMFTRLQSALSRLSSQQAYLSSFWNSGS
jgi:flagellar hook-associated protein 2